MSVVRLHEARVQRASRRGRRWTQRAPIRLLDDSGENDAMIDERSVRPVLDRVVDILDHLGRVVVASLQPPARTLERVQVVVPHVFERDPLLFRREVGGFALVVGVAVCSGADPVVGVVDVLACGTAAGEGLGAVDLRKGRRVVEFVLARECDGEDDDDD